jgi:hypothetical protein
MYVAYKIWPMGLYAFTLHRYKEDQSQFMDLGLAPFSC